MTFKNQKWIPYGKRANSIDIIVKDNNGNTIDSFKVYHQKGQFEKGKRVFTPKKVIKILKEKYGFNFKIEKEKDWLKKDMEW